MRICSACGVDTEDPTNLKRFVSEFDAEQGGGRVRVYVQQISSKLVAVTVEFYEKIVITYAGGIREFEKVAAKGDVIAGADVFALLATHGFPLELRCALDLDLLQARLQPGEHPFEVAGDGSVDANAAHGDDAGPVQRPDAVLGAHHLHYPQARLPDRKSVV